LPSLDRHWSNCRNNYYRLPEQTDAEEAPRDYDREHVLNFFSAGVAGCIGSSTLLYPDHLNTDRVVLLVINSQYAENLYGTITDGIGKITKGPKPDPFNPIFSLDVEASLPQNKGGWAFLKTGNYLPLPQGVFTPPKKKLFYTRPTPAPHWRC